MQKYTVVAMTPIKKMPPPTPATIITMGGPDGVGFGVVVAGAATTGTAGVVDGSGAGVVVAVVLAGGVGAGVGAGVVVDVGFGTHTWFGYPPVHEVSNLSSGPHRQNAHVCTSDVPLPGHQFTT